MYFPSCIFFLMPHPTFSEMDLLVSCYIFTWEDGRPYSTDYRNLLMSQRVHLCCEGVFCHLCLRGRILN